MAAIWKPPLFETAIGKKRPPQIADPDDDHGLDRVRP